MLTVLSWILFGLVIGAVARLLVPGRDPTGWVATLVLGVVGALIGGGLTFVLGFATEPYAPAGWIMATVGAVIALLVYHVSFGEPDLPPV